MKNADYPRNIIKELSGFTVAEIPENFFDRFYRLLNDALTEREKEMLVMYYSTDKTFAEIGQQYGLSEQRVQKIIKKAIQKVRVFSACWKAKKTKTVLLMNPNALNGTRKAMKPDTNKDITTLCRGRKQNV